MEKLIKSDTLAEVELVSGERVPYYPYINPPETEHGEGQLIGERENGERIYQYDGRGAWAAINEYCRKWLDARKATSGTVQALSS